MTKIDEFDSDILTSLQKDARTPIATLSEQVNLSPTPVSRRLKRLEQDGVIRRYSAVLNPKKLGYEIEAYIQVNLQAHTDANIRSFRDAIEDLHSVIACHAVTGDMDFLLHVLAENMDHLSQVILKNLVRIPGVSDVKSMLVLETIKKAEGLPLPQK